MRHLVACLLCIVLLALMVAIFGVVLGGTFRDFATGKSFDPATVMAMFSPLQYRKVLIASIVAMAFAMLDIRALVSRTGNSSRYVQPQSVPLKFAALRARRYLLPIVVLFYLGLFIRLTEGSRGTGSYVTEYDAFIFVGLFAIARRPLNWTVGHVFTYLSQGGSDFLKEIGHGSR